MAYNVDSVSWFRPEDVRAVAVELGIEHDLSRHFAEVVLMMATIEYRTGTEMPGVPPDLVRLCEAFPRDRVEAAFAKAVDIIRGRQGEGGVGIPVKPPTPPRTRAGSDEC